MDLLEPSMTSEIAEELGWSRQTAYEVLNGLAGRGRDSQEEAGSASGNPDSNGIAVIH